MKEQYWNNEACFFIIFEVIIENPPWNWKNIKYHISPRKVPITYENFEVLTWHTVRNLVTEDLQKVSIVYAYMK